MATITRPVTKTIVSTTAWGVPITDQVNANTTDIAALKAAPMAWVNATLINGWANVGAGYTGAQYRKIGDMVYLRAVITGPFGSAAFVLPVGYRPPSRLQIPVVGYTSATTFASVEMWTDGTFVPSFPSGNGSVGFVTSFSITA